MSTDTITAPAITTPAAPVAPTAPAMPSVHRRALLTWLAVYPSITAAFLLLGPYLGGLPVPLRTLAMTAVVVPVVVYGVMPLLMKANARIARRTLGHR
ncbi:hypothetical protein ACIBCA_19325 [Kitasatospora sp. NPDC051170]|uniref:hypothetical protein n=1 Tax=Kitasatospora sp. NPDC051170 TaxID=3364056 RepID=UPI0037A95BD8